jgi:glycosyltransferase involved in cell wall biosynthesis
MMWDQSSLPKVVALMPAWNAESFILPVLESLAAQTYPNLQILISDDASTDRTAEICEEFEASHANFRLIRQPRNLGWIGNVNALLSKAEGEYFFFAFHDDLLRPRYVERLADALDSNPRAVLAFSDMIRRVVAADPAPDDIVAADPLPETIKVYLDLEGVTDRLERGVRVARKWGEPPSYIVMLTNRGLFRGSAARQVGGLRRHIAGEFGADWPWLLRLSLLGEFVRVPEALVEKCYRHTSRSASWKFSLWQRLGALIACMRETRRARLPIAEELVLQRVLVEYALKRQWWEIRKGALRGIRSRLWRPAAGD